MALGSEVESGAHMPTWRVNALRVLRVQLVGVVVLIRLPDPGQIALQIGANLFEQRRDNALGDAQLFFLCDAVLLRDHTVGQGFRARVKIEGIVEVKDVSVVHQIVLDRVVNVRNFTDFKPLYLL